MYCGFQEHKQNITDKFVDLLKYIALFLLYIICIVKYQHKPNICNTQRHNAKSGSDFQYKQNNQNV
jgi:hypothetical protein